MDSWVIVVAAAVVGYLCGSISFARLVYAHLRPGAEPEPIRVPTLDGEAELLSYKVSATSVMVAFGPRWGMLTMALDALKGFLPTLAFRLLFPGSDAFLVAAAFALAGHLWPVWYRFAGGGGNSILLGNLLAISPVGLVVTQAVGGLLGMVLPRFAFMLGNLLTIPWFAWRDGLASPEVAYAVVINFLYIGAQIPETIESQRLARAGHKVDAGSVMRSMRTNARNIRGPETTSESAPVSAGVAPERAAEREGVERPAGDATNR